MANVAESIPFGPLLRQHRLAAGLTQEVLAERTGLGVRSIQHLEGGTHLPHRETLQRLLRALGLGDEERRRLERAAWPAPRQRGADSASSETLPGDHPYQPAPGFALPNPLTSFVGREREVDEVRRLLLRADVRLLTLTGTGGVGKTRLSLAAVAILPEAFPDGVAFVPLGAVREPGAMARAVAQVLGVRDLGGRPAAAALWEFLHERDLLLVLDNLEQIAEAPLLIAGLLGACPHLKVLATSRRALQISAEHEYVVPPLDLPSVSHAPPLAPLGQSDAVRLFLERARAVRPGLILDDENVRAVAEICVSLDGLPLAIELAAARVRLLSPVALRDRLADPHGSSRLRLLTGGAKDLPPRQQTLRATIAWSHDLLTVGERRLFRHLAVFVGSFGIAAAEAIGSALGDDGVLDGLEALVRDGLLERSEGGGRGGREPRLALLETIREFAGEQLEASGERSAAERAHAEYYAKLFEEAAPWLRTGKQLAWLERLDPEQANLRAALAWAAREGGPLGLRIVASAWDYWDLRALTFEVVETALRLIAQSDTSERANAPERLRTMALMICTTWPGHVRWALAEDCLPRARAVGYREGIARSLLGLADAAVYRDHDLERAVVLLHEGLELARDLGDPWVAGRILAHLGRVAWHQGDRASARVAFTESVASFREAGDRWGSPTRLDIGGTLPVPRGRMPRPSLSSTRG